MARWTGENALKITIADIRFVIEFAISMKRHGEKWLVQGAKVSVFLLLAHVRNAHRNVLHSKHSIITRKNI